MARHLKKEILYVSHYHKPSQYLEDAWTNRSKKMARHFQQSQIFFFGQLKK
jgi:hypothetical protein